MFSFVFIKVTDSALVPLQWSPIALHPPTQVNQLKVKQRQKAHPWNNNGEGAREEMIMAEGHQNVFRDFTDVADKE